MFPHKEMWKKSVRCTLQCLGYKRALNNESKYGKRASNINMERELQIRKVKEI